MTSVVLATGGYDHTIKFWEATSGICYKTLQHSDSHINKLEITSDKKLLAAAGNPKIKIYDVQSANNTPDMQYEHHAGNVTCIGFQKDSKWMFSGSDDYYIRIWDLRTPGYKREMSCKSAVNTAVLHPNQGELISGHQSGNIRVWDLATAKYTCELVPEIGVPIRSITVALDGSLLAASNDSGVCYIWKMLRSNSYIQRCEPFKKLVAHPGKYILKTLISPDLRYLATASSDKTVKLWCLDGFREEGVLNGHNAWVWDCVFSVDAAYIVTCSSDATAKLWDLSRFKDIRTYNGHQKAVIACALNDSAPCDS